MPAVFVKVAEFQRRGVVHFHALIRLDAAGEGYEPPPVPLTTIDLAAAIRDAVSLVRLIVPVLDRALLRRGAGAEVEADGEEGPDTHTGERYDSAQRVAVEHVGNPERQVDREQDGVRLPQVRPPDRVLPPEPINDAHTAQYGHGTLHFGTQVDVQALDDNDGELTPERVAAYIAKYATESAEDFGLGDRRLTWAALSGDGVSAHVARLARTCWDLGELADYAGIRRWVHMLGFRGHFASKSRRYSTTLGAIRGERRTYRQRQAAEHARQLGVDQVDEDTTLVVSRWEFVGLGYLNGGDAALALSAAARAREGREAARDHIRREEDS